MRRKFQMIVGVPLYAYKGLRSLGRKTSFQQYLIDKEHTDRIVSRQPHVLFFSTSIQAHQLTDFMPVNKLVHKNKHKNFACKDWIIIFGQNYSK